MRAPEAGTDLWLREALHDLSQPLTALECGLYLGTMSSDGVCAPTQEELLATILEALGQCERAMSLVRAMQEQMNANAGREAKEMGWSDS